VLISETRKNLINEAYRIQCEQSNLYPLDVIRVCELYGAKYHEDNLPSKIDGIYIVSNKNTPHIIINKKNSVNRKRFSCSHEIGHLLLANMGYSKEAVFLDTFQDISTNPAERLCNQFAANLLMPEKQIRAYYSELRIYNIGYILLVY